MTTEQLIAALLAHAEPKIMPVAATPWEPEELPPVEIKGDELCAEAAREIMRLMDELSALQQSSVSLILENGREIGDLARQLVEAEARIAEVDEQKAKESENFVTLAAIILSAGGEVLVPKRELEIAQFAEVTSEDWFLGFGLKLRATVPPPIFDRAAATTEG